MKKYKVLKDFPYTMGFMLSEERFYKFYKAGDIIEVANGSHKEDEYHSKLIENGFIEEIKPNVGRFIPDSNEKYFYVDSYGGVDYTQNKNISEDIYRILRGNCYRTEEEAKRADDIALLNQEIKDFADEYNEDWVADWSDGFVERYFLDYSFSTGWGYTCIRRFYIVGGIHFKDSDFLQPLLDKFGDRLDLLKPELN